MAFKMNPKLLHMTESPPSVHTLYSQSYSSPVFSLYTGWLSPLGSIYSKLLWRPLHMLSVLSLPLLPLSPSHKEMPFCSQLFDKSLPSLSDHDIVSSGSLLCFLLGWARHPSWTCPSTWQLLLSLHLAHNILTFGLCNCLCSWVHGLYFCVPVVSTMPGTWWLCKWITQWVTKYWWRTQVLKL